MALAVSFAMGGLVNGFVDALARTGWNGSHGGGPGNAK